ncbi:hypothetical protein GCM10023178_37390 [Actinomadura luteofluorescens]
MQHLRALPGYEEYVLRDIKDTNTPALKLYAKLGFTKYERRSSSCRPTCAPAVRRRHRDLPGSLERARPRATAPDGQPPQLAIEGGSTQNRWSPPGGRRSVAGCAVSDRGPVPSVPPPE